MSSDWKPEPRAGQEHGTRSAKATLAGRAAHGSATGRPQTGAVRATVRPHKTMFEALRPSRDTVKLPAPPGNRPCSGLAMTVWMAAGRDGTIRHQPLAVGAGRANWALGVRTI